MNMINFYLLCPSPLCRQRGGGHIGLLLSVLCVLVHVWVSTQPNTTRGWGSPNGMYVQTEEAAPANIGLDQMLGQCWPTVNDAEPTLAHNWVNVSCLVPALMQCVVETCISLMLGHRLWSRWSTFKWHWDGVSVYTM